MNTQLLRTNILLSGQVKWDIAVAPYNGKLIVKSFNLVPVAQNIPFDYYKDNQILNYSHQYNINKLWNDIQGYFWDTYESPELKNSWPIITNNSIDSHCNTYESGPSRAKYSKYNKQFEYLVPIWLEKLEKNKSLQLTIQVGGCIKRENNELAIPDYFVSKTLDFKEISELPENNTHNRFCRYFRNYLDYVGITNGQYDVMEIKLKNNTAWVSGIDVSSGNFVKKDISQIVTNIISRERPLMEIDSIIINELCNNNIILCQLFNFNIYFDIEDLLPENLCNDLRGNNIRFNIQSSIQNINDIDNYENLPIKDIYSNYEYIPKEKIGKTRIDSIFNSSNHPGSAAGDKEVYDKTSTNVLSYLSDYKIIDFIQKNKIVQKIIHWSLQDNPSYIFNVYNGFSGYYINTLNDEVESTSHTYGNCPDTGSIKNNTKVTPNNICWAQWMEITPGCMNDLLKFNYNWTSSTGESIESPHIEIFNKASDMTSNWVKNIKYNTNVKLSSNDQITQFKLMLVYLVSDTGDDTELQNLLSNARLNKLNDALYWAKDPNDVNLIYLISYNMDYLTFGYVKNILSTKTFSDINMSYLSEMIQSYIEPELISFNNSLYLKPAQGPSLNIEEMTYYKNNRANPSENYVLRYDGRVVPCFIDPSDTYINYVYYKDQISDDRSKGTSNLQSSIYAKYIKTGYAPLYPSISYFGISYIQENYNENIMVKTSNGLQRLVPVFEPKHFNDSKYLVLNPSLTYEIYSKYESKDDILNNIKVKLSEKYNISDDLLDYVYSLYDINIDYEYDYSSASDENPQAWLDNYIYKVSLQLK